MISQGIVDQENIQLLFFKLVLLALSKFNIKMKYAYSIHEHKELNTRDGSIVNMLGFHFLLHLAIAPT